MHIQSDHPCLEKLIKSVKEKAGTFKWPKKGGYYINNLAQSDKQPKKWPEYQL